MKENKDEESTEEEKYDAEMCILKSRTVSKQLQESHVKNWFKRHSPDKTLPFYLKSGIELWQEL